LIRPLGNDDLVRTVKDALDIVDVIGGYVDLAKRGSSHVGLCPFHAEKTPSFSVNQPGQFFYCFGCRKSGDVFDFVSSIEGISFKEALKQLADRAGIQVDVRPVLGRAALRRQLCDLRLCGRGHR